MKISFSLLIAAFVLCNVCIAQTLPYQSHSFNDLDYIIQQLIKGVDAFKFDVNAMDTESCLKYSTWKASDNKCSTDDSNKVICCFGLRGDTSSSPRVNNYFNTTYEFLSVFANPKYDFVWKRDARLPRYNRTIYIAINIQYTYVQGETTKYWVSQLLKTVEERNLDIKFMLGMPDVMNYYAGLCKNKSKDCDAQAQIIANYPFILQGKNFFPEPVPFGVEDNFNTPFPNISSFCSAFFPTYGDPTPYFFYEIAHEADVQFIANSYMSPQCNRTATHPDLSSIRITSNIDPEMMENYLPQTNPLASLSGASNILVETLTADQLILFSYYEASQDVTHIQVRSLTSSLQLVSEVLINGAASTKMSYKAPYLLIQNETQAQIFLVSSSSTLSLKSLYAISSPGLTTDILTYNDDVYFAQVGVEGQCGTGSLSFTITNLNTGALVLSHCAPVTIFDVNEIQSASLALGLESTNVLRGILFVSATYTYSKQTKDALFAFEFSVSLLDLNMIQVFSFNTPKSYIDWGVDPNVKLIENNGTLFVLEAHSNGICQCANFFNNGNSYKCGISNTINYHLAYLQNIQHLMNYNWGKLDDFVERIESGNFVNACDGEIMHAKFYNGDKPSGTVFRNSTTGYLQALIVSQPVDYDDLPLVTKLFCGATAPINPGDAEVFVSTNMFNILDFYLFEYL